LNFKAAPRNEILHKILIIRMLSLLLYNTELLVLTPQKYVEECYPIVLIFKWKELLTNTKLGFSINFFMESLNFNSEKDFTIIVGGFCTFGGFGGRSGKWSTKYHICLFATWTM